MVLNKKCFFTIHRKMRKQNYVLNVESVSRITPFLCTINKHEGFDKSVFLFQFPQYYIWLKNAFTGNASFLLWFILRDSQFTFSKMVLGFRSCFGAQEYLFIGIGLGRLTVSDSVRLTTRVGWTRQLRNPFKWSTPPAKPLAEPINRAACCGRVTLEWLHSLPLGHLYNPKSRPH